MVLHDTPHPLHSLHKLGLGLVYAAVMVSGTALLMAAFTGNDNTSMTGADGNSVTRAEVVMQSAAERALVSPQGPLVAGNVKLANEERGLAKY
jgi:hypothetical protein